MQTNNNTPFPCVAWESADSTKAAYLTCLTRVKYALSPSNVPTNPEWVLRLVPDQGEFFGGDIYYQEDITKPVRYESDFIPYKAKTDVVINAKTYSPDGRPSNSWKCAAKVLDPDGVMLKSCELKVYGARQYSKSALGWFKTPIKPVTQVSLAYDQSYGGTIIDPNSESQEIPKYLAVDNTNPAGTGITNWRMATDDFPVHQVEWAKASMVFKNYPPGFGFINRTWPIRVKHAGTYDKQWLEQQHPYPPHDFDFFHHQSANPQLILDGTIAMHSKIELDNLLPAAPKVKFTLPELHCFVEKITKDKKCKRHKLAIDTVLIDIESDNSKDWAVYLSYRHYQILDTPIEQLTFQYYPAELVQKKKHNKAPLSKKAV